LINTKMVPLLECRDLVVDFGRQRALDRMSFRLYPGEIVGLVGANGAGKSTFGRVLVGELPFGSYGGDLRLRGEPVRFVNTRSAHAAGIMLIHQEGAAIDQISIGENVMLTNEPTRHGLIDWPTLHSQASSALDRLGAATDTRRRLGDQGGVALVELVEIARAMLRGGSIFVFDESTAALGADETNILLKRMRELAATGVGIVFISHRIDEILSVCDRIVVLRDGRKVLDAPRQGQDHRSVVSAMLGTDPDRHARVAERPDTGFAIRSDTPPILDIEGWRVEKGDAGQVALGPLDFEVHQGEVLGVFGALGAGKTELLQSLFGLAAERCSGRLTWDGNARSGFQSPREAIHSGLVLVSADRQKEGVVPQLSVIENMMLGWHRADLKRGGLMVRNKAATRLCKDLIRQIGVRTEGPDQTMATLSGGNQQKVLLARALINAPRLLLLDEPTRGIDIGAKRDIYRWIRDVAGRGTAVMVSSLEPSELIGLADRIVVLRDGQQLATLSGYDATEHELLVLAAGGNRH
jgi:ABC-type sugar transport system ATPase subunit